MARHRKPAVRLTLEQLLARCKAQGRSEICAGQALAIQHLMNRRGWLIADLHRSSTVSFQMLSDILAVNRGSSVELMEKIAKAFGMELYEFEFLSWAALRGIIPL